VEEKKKLEYIQQLWNKMLEKEAVLLERLKDPRSQDLSTRKLLPETRRVNGPPRRLKGNNQRSTTEAPQ